MVNAFRAFSAGIPWRSFISSMNLLDSHDRARFQTVVGGNIERHLVGATLLFTYPGVPSIFAGDEVGLEGSWGEDARRTIDWENPDDWNLTLFDAYKKLIRIRKDSDALCHGGLRWIYVDTRAIAYFRESDREAILVVVAAEKTKININLEQYGYRVDKTLHGPVQKGKKIALSIKGPLSGIWRLA